jgi:hypothetical protein
MTISATARELARRTVDGLDIRLLWDAFQDAIMVAVVDSRTGNQWVIPAPRGEALHAFNHPFAHVR